MSIGLIVGSFDPLLRGQVDLIARAFEIIGRVIVAVEVNPSHDPLYSIEERVRRVSREVAAWQGVEVRPYDGNFTKFVAETGATTYIVALRSSVDVEQVIAEIRPLCDANGVELITLLAHPEHAFVTTALVRDVARLGGDITLFVPTD